MDSLSKIIATVHATVHDFKLMKQYSEPKIYHGGGLLIYPLNL